MNQPYVLQAETAFADSLIWDLNRNYYETQGIEAWSSGAVPSNLTSNSFVGKTYAALIFGFLKDLANQNKTTETVYIVELGAGHGRFAFHVLKHLESLTTKTTLELPSFCYVLTDIASDNLSFFMNHPQLQTYFERGVLDVAYLDAMEGESLELKKSGKTITAGDLQQPLIAIANYFFDSIPTDLFHFKNSAVSSCSVALETAINPKGLDTPTLIKLLKTNYTQKKITAPFYENKILNEMVLDYQKQLRDTYLFFPKKGLQCIDRLRAFSKEGLMLLSMDKGFYNLSDLENVAEPDMITHGSLSFWVNFNALETFCKKSGGHAFFSTANNFQFELGCLLFLSDDNSYEETQIAYQRFVNDFGPGDYNSLKKASYKNIAHATLSELFTMIRLSAYDSSFFMAILPRIKQLARRISKKQRILLNKTMHQVWDMYFTLYEKEDLAYEIGGLLYDLGFYQEALQYFVNSTTTLGEKADVFYNQILCHYQLRQDDQFRSTLKVAKAKFPNYKRFAQLEALDLNA